MILICLTGPLQGREFSVPPGGLTIGRAKDNVIVLTDDTEISRYHARIEALGMTWYLHDRESSNGVFLNGRRLTQSVRVSDQDEIRIGTTHFRAMTQEPGVEAPLVTIKAAEPMPEDRLPEGEELPPIAPDANASAAVGVAAARVRKRRLLLAGILALVVVAALAAIAVKTFGTTPKPDLALAAKPAGPKDLRVYYEKIEVTPAVVFRFELSIQNGEMRLRVDDVVNDRRVEEEKTLRDDQLEILASSLLTKDFLALAPVPAETRQGGLSRVQLLVQVRERGNWITVENAVAPQAFAAVVQALLTFVQEELSVFSEPIPREEALRLSAEEYASAKRLFDERSVDPANLYRAVRAYRQVLERLKRFEDKPDWFATATNEMQEAQKTLDDELNQFMRNALTAKTSGNLEEARRLLEALIAMVPDRDYEMARKARSEMITINQLIQQKQRKH